MLPGNFCILFLMRFADYANNWKFFKQKTRKKSILTEKRPWKPYRGKNMYLVARPVCLLRTRNWRAGSRRSASYYQVRLGPWKCRSHITRKLFQLILNTGISQEIVQSEYADVAAKCHSLYALFPKYELMAGGKEFSIIPSRRITNKSMLTLKNRVIENLGRF